MNLPGYELVEDVWRTEWQVLSRGRLQEDGRSVLLKFPRREPLRSADADLLEREFELLRRLEVEGIARPTDFIRGRDHCAVVFDDCGEVLLSTLLGSGPILGQRFFAIATRLVSTLAELHRRDLTHGGLNPAGILVHPQTLRTSLIDFRPSIQALAGGPTHNSTRLWRDLLPYISPEQTGRIKRTPDYRSDFYSLGLVFHEMLTGARVCPSDSPLEAVHWHVAQAPSSPHDANPEVPEVLAQIVLKLLAKAPEDRYQSALGIKEDLETCAREISTGGNGATFPLGRKDMCDRLVIPHKLYGREKEVAALLAAFEEACDGQSTLLLVGGYSGIGKTSLIQEIYKPIIRQRGYFLSGNFDQIVRNIPFGALIQAFQGLVRQLPAESEERLEYWRTRLSEALGPNAAVVAEVIPEIELILEKQAPLPAVGPVEAQNRFQLAFQDFVGAVAQANHPLVVFLDNLQWADPATLNLLQPLLSSPEARHLLLIGAYRDNEVDAAHPLARAISSFDAAGARVRRLMLEPLGIEALSSFVHDALRGEGSDAESLASLIQRKTDGNPFFVIQFLKSLHHEGLLKFDYERVRWTFQIDAIERAGMTDNVVDLMARKIRHLSIENQYALTLAACLGNPFDVTTLATVNNQTEEEAVRTLQESLNGGLIVPFGGTLDAATATRWPADATVPGSYSFLHDRVQQAAYALIPDDRKQRVHLMVGRLLLQSWDREQAEENVFSIVGHLNLGRALITEENERVALAELNLAAGRKAKLSTAFQTALGYFDAGVSVLSDGHWNTQYDLTLKLHLEAAECKYLCGDYEGAEDYFARILARARTLLDKARAYCLRVTQYAHTSHYAQAIQTAREGLALFAVNLPEKAEEKAAALEAEIAAIRELIGDRSIESLADLPVMTHPEIQVVMRILTEVWAPAYLVGDPLLTRVVSATLVRHSLAHGNTEGSAYGYVTHAITVGPVKGDYQAAFEFGKVALRVNERLNDVRQRAKVHQQFGAHVNLFRRPMHTCLPHAREACRSGLQTGDFTYANYGAFVESWFAFLVSRDLARFAHEYSPNLRLIQRLKVPDFIEAQKVLLSWGQALQRLSSHPTSLSNGDFEENAFIEAYGGSPVFMTFYYIPKLHLQVTFEEYGKALETARSAQQVGEALAGTIWPPLLNFLRGLALAANLRQAPEDQKPSFILELASSQAYLEPLAESCPENFLCLLLMLRAEIARVQDRALEAMDLYEQALRYADDTRSLLNGSLAADLFSRFWRERGSEAIAGLYAEEACTRYTEWGAKARVDDLTERHPHLRSKRAAQPGGPQRTSDDQRTVDPADQGPVSLDINTVVKTARAVAGEIGLEGLLRKLMTLALENAGAQRGAFLAERDGELFLEASCEFGQELVVRQSIPLAKVHDIAQAVVRCTRKTHESVVIADATTDERFAGDPHIRQSCPKSILSVPVVREGKLGGILYLENNLTTDAFTPERLEIMQILSSTAAISLANARLYEGMKQEVALRRRAEERERTLLEVNNAIITKLTREELFKAVFQSLRRIVPFDLTAIFLHDPENDVLRVVVLESSVPSRDFVVGLEVAPDDSHVGYVFRTQKRLVRRDMRDEREFATEELLLEQGLHSSIVVPLVARGETVGVLNVAALRPGQYTESDAEFLQEVANQVALAIANMKVYEEIAALKGRLQDENVYLQEEIRHEHNFEEMVGSSPALLEVLRKIEDVAPTDTTVLIAGETGTGKELLARAVHDRSARRDRPLVKVNCAAISAGLVESELFGHVKGAFTGAIERGVGRFEVADGGTLFLDEVGELPLETQVKLLRVLQEQEFESVGSSRTIRVDVRIIAATNRDLEEAVRMGRFRSDLYYRLNVFPLNVPPLRERRSDIPQLVMFFLERFCKKFGKRIESIPQEAMDMLTAYPWPGNIRELQNVVERGVVLCRGPVFKLGRDLFPDFSRKGQPDVSAMIHPTNSLPSLSDGPLAAIGLPGEECQTLDEVQRRHIVSALAKTGGVIEGPKGAARILNLNPNTLRSRMKKLGISRLSHGMS